MDQKFATKQDQHFVVPKIPVFSIKMVLWIGFSLVLINVLMDAFRLNFMDIFFQHSDSVSKSLSSWDGMDLNCYVFPVAHLPEMSKIITFMAQLWNTIGAWNWFSLNLNQCAHECCMPNFKIPEASFSPLFLEMSKIWVFYGPNMVLIWSLKWILPKYYVPKDALCQISLCLVNPVVPYPRNGQNVALLWLKHGPHILQIGSSWILSNVPRDV